MYRRFILLDQYAFYSKACLTEEEEEAAFHSAKHSWLNHDITRGSEHRFLFSLLHNIPISVP